jgi:hypothetical protein
VSSQKLVSVRSRLKSKDINYHIKLCIVIVYFFRSEYFHTACVTGCGCLGTTFKRFSKKKLKCSEKTTDVLSQWKTISQTVVSSSPYHSQALRSFNFQTWVCTHNKKKQPIRTLHQINTLYWLDNFRVGVWKSYLKFLWP